ncbi:Uncharacterised protein [uncultured archaeon]|nr:Uncharacterised protein [uncultured archaeon]
MVRNCIENIMLKKINGLYINDIDEKVLDATVIVMQKIKEHVRIHKLSSFCYYPAIGVLWNRKERKREKIVSLESCIDDRKHRNTQYKQIM